jgi:hypothetical protein
VTPLTQQPQRQRESESRRGVPDDARPGIGSPSEKEEVDEQSSAALLKVFDMQLDAGETHLLPSLE